MRGQKQRATVYRTFSTWSLKAVRKLCLCTLEKNVQYSVACCKHFCRSATITVCNQCKSMTSNLTHAAWQNLFSSDIILALQNTWNFMAVSFCVIASSKCCVDIFCYKATGQIIGDKQMEIQVEACLLPLKSGYQVEVDLWCFYLVFFELLQTSLLTLYTKIINHQSPACSICSSKCLSRSQAKHL